MRGLAAEVGGRRLDEKRVTHVTDSRVPLLGATLHQVAQTQGAEHLAAVQAVLLLLGTRETLPTRWTLVNVVFMLPSNLGVRGTNFF